MCVCGMGFKCLVCVWVGVSGEWRRMWMEDYSKKVGVDACGWKRIGEFRWKGD